VVDWPADKARLQVSGVSHTERLVPLLRVRQVFFTDPDSVTIELNYPGIEGL
jgi:hypothetical protein